MIQPAADLLPTLLTGRSAISSPAGDAAAFAALMPGAPAADPTQDRQSAAAPGQVLPPIADPEALVALYATPAVVPAAEAGPGSGVAAAPPIRIVVAAVAAMAEPASVPVEDPTAPPPPPPLPPSLPASVIRPSPPRPAARTRAPDGDVAPEADDAATADEAPAGDLPNEAGMGMPAPPEVGLPDAPSRMAAPPRADPGASPAPQPIALTGNAFPGTASLPMPAPHTPDRSIIAPAMGTGTGDAGGEFARSGRETPEPSPVADTSAAVTPSLDANVRHGRPALITSALPAYDPSGATQPMATAAVPDNRGSATKAAPPPTVPPATPTPVFTIVRPPAPGKGIAPLPMQPVIASVPLHWTHAPTALPAAVTPPAQASAAAAVTIAAPVSPAPAPADTKNGEPPLAGPSPITPQPVSEPARAEQRPPAAPPVPPRVVAPPSIPGVAEMSGIGHAPQPLRPAPRRTGEFPTVADVRAPAPVVAEAPALPAAPATLDMRRQDWPRDMVGHIERLRDAADAVDTRIRLVPDMLGQVEVDVRRDGDTLHVRFSAEQPQTRALLQDAQPRLAEAAESRGLKLGQASVDAGASQQQQRQPAPHSSATPRGPRAARPETRTDDERVA